MKEMVFRVSNNNKCKVKAMKEAVSVNGVTSVSWVKKNKDWANLVVVGDEVDPVKLAMSLRKRVGHTDIVSVGIKEEEYTKKLEAEVKREEEYTKKLEAEVTPHSSANQQADAAREVRHYKPTKRLGLGSFLSGTVVDPFKRVTKSKIPEQSHGDNREAKLECFDFMQSHGDNREAKLECFDYVKSSVCSNYLECRTPDEEKQDNLELLIATPVITASSTPDLYEQHAGNQNHPSPNVYHSRALVFGFQAEVLVELILSHTRDNQFWHGRQRLGSLRSLDISQSKLKKLPDLSRACNLKSLYLEGCTDLVDVSSIRNLGNLEILILRGCRSLQRLPIMTEWKHIISIDLADCSNLREIPLSIGFLSSLISLDLQNCKELQYLPPIVVSLESLKKINLSGCSKLLKLTSVTAADDAENIGGPLHFDAYSALEKVTITPTDSHREGLIEELESSAQLFPTPSQQHWRELQRHMGMPLEAIHESGSFLYVEGIARTLIQQISDLHDMSVLKDITSCLEEFKDTIPDVLMCEKVAHDNRSALQVKSTRVGQNLAEAIEEFNSLDVNLAKIFAEEANLEAEFEHLMAKKKMLSEDASKLEA